MEFEELIQNFEGNYGRLLSPFEIELVREMVEVEGYAIELVNEALKIAIGNGKFFPNYVSGVLRRMRSRGIRTVHELKDAEQQKRQASQVSVPTVGFYESLIAATEMWGSDEARERNIPVYQKEVARLRALEVAS